MNISITEAFAYLLGKKHFYATVANALRRVPSPGMGKMGVGIQDGRVILFYDRDFVRKLSLPAFAYALEHEMVHVVMDHIPRYLELLSGLSDPVQRQRAEEVFQIAADCADNSLLCKSRWFEAMQKELRALILEERRARD